MGGRKVWWLVGAAVLLLAALGVWGLVSAKQFKDLAYTAKADAVSAVGELAAERPDAAADLFEKAEDGFAKAAGLLGPDWLHGLPWAGRQLAAADDLATIGREASSAGGEAARLMVEVSRVPETPDRLSAILPVVRPRLDSALVSLAAVAQRADRLSTDGLVPELADAVGSANEVLAPMGTLLDRSDALLQLERHLFSTQHRFLVVAQNSSELRPTGGFMGTYGLLRFGPDGFAMETFADIYTLPKDTLNEPLPAGGQVNYKHFYFRNTNWWMDFPTSAAMMTKFWQNLEQPPIDGIIAIDIPLLQELLKVYGPITVPESSRPLTAKNVMEELNRVVQYEYSGEDDPRQRKTAVVSLVDEMMRRLTGLDAEHLMPTLTALTKAANEKHVQVFLTDPEAQAAMVDLGWSGAIAPEGATDLLAVSNGVIKPSKANWEVSKSLDYQVVLAEDGTADTTLTAGYRKGSKLQLGVPQQWLANYLRVHRPAGTELASGGSTFDALADATGLPTFGHYFRLDPGASTEVALRSSVPGALAPDPADANTRRYRLVVAKQADLVNTDLTVRVTPPDGWRVARTAASWRASGEAITATLQGNSVVVTTPLMQDLSLDVDLTRA